MNNRVWIRPQELALGTVIGVFTLSILVIVGWFFSIPELLQLHPAFVPMQFNTALCFLLCSICLNNGNHFNRQENVIPVIILGITSLTLLQYIFGIDLYIDEFFMEANIVTNTSSPGRMAPNTGCCFMLFALTFLLPEGSIRQLEIKGVLSSFIFCLGLIACGGYVLQLPSAYGWMNMTQMALHTAVGFMLLGFGMTVYFIEKERKLKKALSNPNKLWMVGYAFSMLILIFLIDMNIPLGVAGGIPYVILILLAWFTSKPKYAIVLGLLSIVLTLIGFFYSASSGLPHWMAITNRVYSILAILVVSVLMYIIKRKELKLLALNAQLDARILQQEEKGKLRDEKIDQYSLIVANDLFFSFHSMKQKMGDFKDGHKNLLGDDGRHKIEVIQRSIHKLEEVIFRLKSLFATKVDRIKKVSVQQIMESVTAQLAPTIQENKANVLFRELPVVEGNEGELRLVFYELMKNSLEAHVEDFPLNIWVSYLKVDDFYHFEFRDDGIGTSDGGGLGAPIDAYGNRSGDAGRMGIGLKMCQRIMESHGGELWFESAIGEGTRVIFKLPIKQHPASDLKEIIPSVSPVLS